jgi:nucleotide-binding universal stress UspA family protein
MSGNAATREVLPVVVGVDGSRNGPAVVDLAAAEAVRHRAPLLIVHAWPGRYTGAFRTRAAVAARADGQHLLDVSASRARTAEPELQVGTRLLDGAATAVLTRLSEQARLLVIGHRDEILTRPSWGSTASYLAHHSASPLLVRRGVAKSSGPVVVAVSGRPSPTVGYAYAEADSMHTRLVAVHLSPSGADEAVPVPLIPNGDYMAERRAAERMLAEAMAGWCADFPDVEVERVLVHDVNVAYTIDRASRRGRVLVMGAGRGRFAEMLHGPARRTQCPVLLVPPGWPSRAGAALGRGRSPAARAF